MQRVARLENQEAVGGGRIAHVDAAIKSAGAKQGLVKSFHSVGCRDYEHLVQGSKPVHLHQQLQQALLPFFRPRVASPSASRFPNRINLICRTRAWVFSAMYHAKPVKKKKFNKKISYHRFPLCERELTSVEIQNRILIPVRRSTPNTTTCTGASTHHTRTGATTSI